MKMKKIEILYIIPKMEIAGTEQHLINLVSNLNSRRFEPLVCCLKGLGKLGELFKKSGGNIVCLNRRSVYSPRIMIDIHRLIKRDRFDIVHTYLFGFHYLAGIPAKLVKVPTVISSRRQLATWKKKHHIILEKLGNRFSDKVIACSNAVRDFSLKQENLYPEKIITIYNGIDIRKFHPRAKAGSLLSEFNLNDSIPIIGIVANCSSVKDHNTLLEALNIVKKEANHAFKCLLVGDGPLKEGLKLKVKNLKLENNVIFLGKRDDIPELLSVIDLFVLTSKVEGLPNVILEAMACGKPVITTSVGGIPEVIIDRESGILVSPQNPNTLAEAIVDLLNDRELREKMGQQGRKIVEEKFSLERMIRDYENLYMFLYSKFQS